MNPTIQSAAMTALLSSAKDALRHMCRSADCEGVDALDEAITDAEKALAARPVTQEPHPRHARASEQLVALGYVWVREDGNWIPNRPPASAPEALSDKQINEMAFQHGLIAEGYWSEDAIAFAREIAALAAPSTPAPDIADAVMDPNGVCPTCFQRLHVEPFVEAAIQWIRDNYQDHNIASLCDGLRALAAPSTPAAPLRDDEIDDLWQAASDYDDGVNIHELVHAVERHYGIGEAA